MKKSRFSFVQRLAAVGALLLSSGLSATAQTATAPVASTQTANAGGRWTAARAQSWQKQHGWLRGSNFMPSTAINQLEMWQEPTFDEATIDRELGYAQSLGFNSMRVFLHDLPWQQDSKAFSTRIDRFLTIADKHRIGVLFVLFDSCWKAVPYLGAQPAPVPYVHNSGWVQSPGAVALQTPQEYPRLRTFVYGVVKRFGNDRRVVGWDVWNEPDNLNASGPGREGLEPANKVALVQGLLPQVFAWARAANPSQPLTSGVWQGHDWSQDQTLSEVEKIQLANSDVISFHNYGDLDDFRKNVDRLRRYNRPILCTEYMARPFKSTFNPLLGFMKEQNVAAYNWGFVSGKSQTIYPWDSWQKAYRSEPTLWFHDILRMDGTPYLQDEVNYIRSVTRS